jgi:AsmA protein
MRWIIRFVVLVVVVAALAVGALFLIPTERIAALIGDQFEKATGRSLAISGAIRPSLYPVLGVRADGIEIGNPGWVTDGPMLKAARLNLGVEAAALWGGEIKVQRFELVEPQIVLVKGADGAVSWTFGEGGEAPQEAESQGNALAGLSVELAEITDGTLYYRDLATGTEVRASALDLALRLPSAEGKARLEGSGMVNGATLSIDAAVEGIAPLLEGRLRPVTLALDWTGGKAGFEGRAGISPPSGEGTLSFDATDLAPLLALAGQGAPSLPKGLGRDRMVVSGTLTVAPEGSVHLRGTNITLDDNSVSGDIDVLTSGARPLIRARLDGGAWDLSAITGGESTPDAEAGWSRVPIDVSALNSADAEAVVTLAGLDLGIMDLGRLNVRAALSEGRLVLDLNEVAAYGGAVTGQYVVNGRGGLSMRGDITLSQVQLGPLLTDFAGFDRLQGTGDARVDVLMSGNDLNALMNSLQGTGSVEFGQGEILGLDIGGMIRNLDTSYRGEGAKTVYDSVTASFVMESGVVSNQDLVLIAKFGEMTGSGTIGVGQQVLDYTLIPRVVYRRGSGATDQSTAQEGADATQTAEQETGAQDAGQVADRELRVPIQPRPRGAGPREARRAA